MNDQAIPELERAVNLAPNSPQAHYALSQAYARAHRKADSNRERAIFTRLKQQEAEAAQEAVARESAGTKHGTPSPPQP